MVNEFLKEDLPAGRDDWKPGEGFTFPGSPLPDIQKVLKHLKKDTLKKMERDLQYAVRHPATKYDRELTILYETWRMVQQELS